MPTGFSQGEPATTIDTINIGLPGLHNITSHPVRLRAVTLVAKQATAHVRSITAYLYSETLGGIGIGILPGDLSKLCPHNGQPSPVTDVVTAPHSDSNWYVAVAVTFSQPGRYEFRRVKIYYITNGQDGWQYQNVNTTIPVTAARKGAKPAFAGCP